MTAARVVRLADLSQAQARLVRALLDAGKQAPPANGTPGGATPREGTTNARRSTS